MAQIAREKKAAVKKVAYEKKQEDSGKKVMEWIFGVLVVLAVALIVFYVYSM